MLRLSGSGVSDPGRRRRANEDAAFVAPYVALVADGVGGGPAGEVASATAAYVVSATALARVGEPARDVLAAGVRAAHRALMEAARDDESRVGMATTLTVVVCDGREVLLGHVGDSRAYRLREGALTLLSRDHTWVQQLQDEGHMDRAAAAVHPWRHVVMRSLGSSPEFGGTDVTALEVRPGDRLLLCSDGLTDLVSEPDVAQALTAYDDPRSAAAVLVHAALEAGGHDNVTCLVLDLVDGPAVVGDGTPLGALAQWSNIADPASVRL